MKIWIDNGHGSDTAGKRSPDGRLREYAYAREIARRVVHDLKAKGLDAELLTPEEEDISLPERCERANRVKDSILVSIHTDAAGDGSQWMKATGWSARIYPNCSDNTRRLADCLGECASGEGIRVRRQYPDQWYWYQNLYILKHTACPAVLTENMFHDNREDVDFLLSEEGKQKITAIHVDGICKYLGV